MINSHFGFTSLKEVWLGDCYPLSYYDHLPNEIADPLRQITEWTREDIGQLQKFLEGQGIRVRRPSFTKIDDYINPQGNLNRPPITPRDHYLVLGNSLYSLHWRALFPKDPWQDIIDLYKPEHDVRDPVNLPINCLSPPSLVRVGKDLYLDRDSHPAVWGFICQWMIETAQNYRVNIAATHGHSDGIFCPVAPGILVTSNYKYNYENTFPDWDIFRLPPGLHNFTAPKNWWVNDEAIDRNHTFSQHILEKAKDWVGESRETVYEVNMLVIDEKNVVIMKEYEPLCRWLDDRGIKTHCFDFRTRSFWDGGWHCLSLDINRDDTKCDLFPDRGDNGVYWRLD